MLRYCKFSFNPGLRQPAFLLAFLLGGYLLSCSAPKAASEAMPLNPNGDSELALLMRAMFGEAQVVKQQIEQGEEPWLGLDYEKILTAQASAPEKVASALYREYAQSYLQTVKALREGRVAEAKSLYNNMVNACMGCHTALCPGPTVRIKQLY